MHVIIISSSTTTNLVNCVSSLVNSSQHIRFNITVISNATRGQNYDQAFVSCEQMARDAGHTFELIRNINPVGYSYNNNMALREINDEEALLLNDDTIVLPNAVDYLQEVLSSDPHIAAVGAFLLNRDGSPQDHAFGFPSFWSTINTAWLKRGFGGIPSFSHDQGSDPFQVDWVSGACMLIRTNALRSVGGLDEGYDPGYGEDMDWCWRFRHGGWLIMSCPRAQVIHIVGQSFGMGTPFRSYRIFYGMSRFMIKNYPLVHALTIRLIWASGLAARVLISILWSKHARKKGDIWAPTTAYISALKGVGMQELITNQ